MIVYGAWQAEEIPPASGFCPTCEKISCLTGRHKVNRDRHDPSEIYELICGHWII